MDRADIAELGTKVYDRVRAKAKADKRDVQFSFQRFALERLLARLESTRFAGGYAVKGGMLMLCLPGGMGRPTEDLDLSSSREMGLDELTAVLREVCDTDPPEEDGLTMSLNEGKCQVLRVESPHPTVRAVIDARLHNRYGGVPIKLMLDVSQGEGIHPALTKVRLPQSCKGFEPPEVPCYPWETVVAEKLHAIVSHGMSNTRMKDYFDLIAIQRNMDIPAERLAEAVVVTFAVTGRDIDTDPVGLSDRFADSREREWKTFTARRNLSTAPATMREAVEAVRTFALPILDAASRAAVTENSSAAPF